MHGETIRSNPSWYGEYECGDTVLVQAGAVDDVMGGLSIARTRVLRAFLGFQVE